MSAMLGLTVVCACVRACVRVCAGVHHYLCSLVRARLSRQGVLTHKACRDTEEP